MKTKEKKNANIAKFGLTYAERAQNNTLRKTYFRDYKTSKNTN